LGIPYTEGTQERFIFKTKREKINRKERSYRIAVTDARREKEPMDVAGQETTEKGGVEDGSATQLSPVRCHKKVNDERRTRRLGE